MKKHIFNLFSATVLSASILTGCIDETLPEAGYATAGQVGASSAALKAAVNGIHAKKVTQGYLVYGDQVHETDISYPSFMIAQTEMLGDMFPTAGMETYDWFASYNTSRGMSENSYVAYLSYFTLYQFIKAANDVIGMVDITDESLSDEMKGYAGMAYADRAFDYYMLTVLFEPKANIYTDCSKVLGLTVPIVTEATTNEIAKNNPRATHDEMMEFILSDLDKAEVLMADFTPESRLLPSLPVVYGLKAKAYLWDENYAKAAEYARKAIDACSGVPMTESEWLDPTSGFNTASSGWMWYIHTSAENIGNLANFIGHIAPEAGWGYSSLTSPVIDASLYNSIAATDFRKHAFVDPDRSSYNYESPRGADWLAGMPDYLALKFRCVGGDVNTYTIGALADIPIMRVEEMYFIEAEAVGASQGVAAGAALLNSFMQTYRQPDYNCTASDLRSFQLEVLRQMRIEFWGEGNAFPSAKRLQPDIIQNYEGTNAPSDVYKINCKGGKPGWTLVIPVDEVNANTALAGQNNPDPSTAIQSRPTPVGEFAEQ